MTTLICSYRLGHADAWEQITPLIAAHSGDQEQRAIAIELCSAWLFAYVDAALCLAEDFYSAERERWVRSIAATRAETIETILAGEPIDGALAGRRLGYALDRQHTAAIAWLQSHGEGRDTHAAMEAAIAQVRDGLGAGGGGTVTRYSQVALAATATADPHQARIFVERELRGLAADDDLSTRVTATLRTYLEEHSSRGRTAKRLGIWVRHLVTGQTVLASRASGAAGAPADADSQTPSIDNAGDRIAFTSTAGNLGNPSPTIFDAHSYLRDLATGSTQLVSRSDGSSGAAAVQPGFTVVSVSGNGNCAAFSARSLTLGDGFASADFGSVHERVLRAQCPVAPPAPSVSGFSPTSGVTGSNVVTITGSNLASASAVKFNGLAARISSDTATQIKATVPNGTTTGKISVTTAGGTATSAASFTPTLSITSFTPASGPAGTAVTVTGTGFTSTSSVKFNGVAATVLSRTPPSKLVAVVPTTASTGNITVTNTTPPVGTVTSASSYTKT